MTARELFRKAGVSAKLYRDFLQPILLVTLFAPGEQLSGILNVKECMPAQKLYPESSTSCVYNQISFACYKTQVK